MFGRRRGRYNPATMTDSLRTNPPSLAAAGDGPPALVAGARGAAWVEPTGEALWLTFEDARARLGRGAMVLVCHGGRTARRLDVPPFAAFDVLELFAFVRPARFCLPTPAGLAQALDLALPDTDEQQAASLFAAVHRLLDDLSRNPSRAAQATAWDMGQGGWLWAPLVLRALADAGSVGGGGHAANLNGLKPWRRLADWEEGAPPPPPGDLPVEPVEARARLARALGPRAEERPGQRDYASQVSAAFQPRDADGEPTMVLAEAGTGVGKTLGYLAPAQAWAEKNGAAVWVSTFTRNLQRQLDGELDRIYPDADEKARYVVVRKGRENYLCLLNLEDAVRRIGSGGADAAGLGLMARWAEATRDGDMVGGDFPSWLAGLAGRTQTVDLTDTRGECVHSACTHYRKCFIESSIRRARRARIVIANHALVMIQAALGTGAEAGHSGFYVFDEGHHVFGAADSAFSAQLGGLEAAELRRWLLGNERSGARASRGRGLRARIEDLIAGNEAAETALSLVLRAAHTLPGPAWHQRIAGGSPAGAVEHFLLLVRAQVLARARPQERNGGYDLECEPRPAIDGVLPAARALARELAGLSEPVRALLAALAAMLVDGADKLDSATRNRIEAVQRGLQRRGVETVNAWRDMLATLEAETPPEYVDWFTVVRRGGHDIDVAMCRHWLDPTLPFATTLAAPAQGVLVTSATLRDNAPDDPDGWLGAEARTGGAHMAKPAIHVGVASPFNHAERTRVFIVNDLDRGKDAQVAAAYRELFKAAGGGGLGLFTAISRLRDAYQRLVRPLADAGITLYAQHVDALDTGTLVDIFRAEENSCLLGTDAVRDGVDVPGRSLRLIVFDRVPWPRPDILHKARRAHFGAKQYDDTQTRLKIKQAYGRLLRRADDYGVFVMLDKSLPSRLLGAFPKGVIAKRVGLAEAIAETGEFLNAMEDGTIVCNQRRDQ